MPTQSRRLITAEDLFALRLPTDPRISPDGARIAFVLQRTDLEKNRYRSALWMVEVESGATRALTTAEARDNAPRWSPDGRLLAFVSDRDETSQIWLLPTDGGEARRLTRLPEGTLSPPGWSPDGAHLLFAYRPRPRSDTREGREEREKGHRSTPPRVIRRLRYREEAYGYVGDERWHLWAVRLSDGELRQLTDGDTDEHAPCWSPDGCRILFVSNRSADPDLTANLQELWVMSFPDAGAPRRLELPAGPKAMPAWSRDGREIAYVGHTQVEDLWGVTNLSLWRAEIDDLDAGRVTARDVTADLDRPLGSSIISDVRAFGGGEQGPIWTEEGHLYCLVGDAGSTHLYEVDREGRGRRRVDGRREVAAVTADSAARRLALLVGSAWEPGDIYVLEIDGMEDRDPAEPRRLTWLNRELLETVKLADPEELRVRSHDGMEIGGWLLRPPEGVTERRAPLILYIHGGPHSQYGNVFFHEMQWHAARGYCVLYANPRGSKGYGRAFTEALRGRWGEADYPDLMAMVDHVIERGDVDPERMAVMGGSYGGFMTNWVVSHTDRFRAAITQRCVTNLMSMAGTCDIDFNERFYFDANAWDDPGGYLRSSPLTYAARVRTPLLILHSEGDLRCPIEQAEQWFAALKRLGCEVEFVRYPPAANHGLSRSGPPDLRLDRLQRIAAWVDRFLMQPEEASS